MFRSSKFLTVLVLSATILLLFAAGCANSRVTLGQAYVAPAVLHLHSDISTKSSVVADLKHADHLEIVDVQRRMIRVRTDKGIEGWTDSGQLLSVEQMAALKQRRQEESTLPGEGTATAYEVLNIHIDPDRQSPAFSQIAEGASVTVLGHKVVPKVTGPMHASGIVISRPPSLSRKQRKDQKSPGGSMRLPPKPAPPKPPANWLELSAERIDGGSDEAAPAAAVVAPVAKPKAEPKPVTLDDWTLIRTKNNEIGWVLTRNLLMSIPDEVAQYAEGKNITAFFNLGNVNDDIKGTKHNWLWATSARDLPYDFDSWRVFLWNTRRHRYETSFRQRNLEGYFPIRLAAGEAGSLLRTFSIVTKDDDGKMRVRSYTFDGHLVHLANTEDYNAAAGLQNASGPALNTNELAAKVKSPNWFKRQWATIKHRIFGS